MFLGYIHSFRALAILFIVAGHSIDFFIWSEQYEALERLLRILISHGASGLFVFIAGYLFQHLAAKYQTKKYFASKLKNVLLPYFLVSIPAIIIFIFFIHRETVWQGFYDNPQWLQVVYFYLTGLHLAPFWFIPMMTLFYLMGPILIRADKNKFFYWILPVAILISCYFGRGLPYQSFVHFFSVYLLGMFCSHYKVTVNRILVIPSVLTLLTGVFLFLTVLEFYYVKGTMIFVNYLHKITLCLFFLGLLIKLGKKLDYKLIRVIADTSFGVFFIHSYVLTGSKMLITKLSGEKTVGNLLLYPLVVIAVLMSCVGIIVIIQKMLGSKSRYLVGS
ncbi:acyltransferase family protein [Colwellia ponticola]|uniref:acyltransferase family protein n=1 Tax=Colwellia ponticola TaxID=2304625 RepID=UPI001486DEC2|nr:acyltransferase [Colwellia ponticola]